MTKKSNGRGRGKKKENGIILYQDENGVTNVTVRFADDDLWLTQNQIAEIYDTTQQNISQHIDGILKDGELPAEATHKKFLLVQTEGSRQVERQIDYYNRVNNEEAMVGMTNFKGNYITKDDVRIAKNYLSEIELQKLNLLSEGFLGYKEKQ